MRIAQIQHVFGNEVRHLSLALLLSVTALAAFAYGAGRSGATGDNGGPIKVGVIVPLSGRLSSFGRSTANGIEMAADEINKAGGISGRRVELIVEDDRGLPDHAVRIATKLIKEDKVHALLGEAASSNSLAAASVAQRFRVPMISPSSTSPRVTQVGNFIFRVCFIDQFQGEVMAEFAIKTLKAKRAAILFANTSEYSRGLSNSFQREFIRRGGRIVQKQHSTLR